MKKLEGYQLAALIERAEYQRFGATTTVCALILNNGFVVIGVSGCLNPADFDEAIGRDTAYKDAFAKLWELQGFHLKTLFAESEASDESN